MITLDQALDTVSQLPAEQREMLEQILHRRRIEEQRRASFLAAALARIFLRSVST